MANNGKAQKTPGPLDGSRLRPCIQRVRLLAGVVLSVLSCTLDLPIVAADSVVQKQLFVVSSADTMIHDTPLLPPGGGDTPTVAAGTTRDNRKARMLLQFDLPSLPPDATLSNVYVALNVAQAPAGGAAAPFSLHRMLHAWDEGEASWTDSGFGAWSAPGALAGVDFASAATATTNFDGSGPVQLRDPSLVDLAHLWMTNLAANLGFILLCDNDVLQTAKRISTREESTESQRPYMVLEYTVPFRILFTRIERVGDTIECDFTAEPGHSYRVEYKENIDDPLWSFYMSFPDPESVTTYTFSDFPDVSQRIYRVVAP